MPSVPLPEHASLEHLKNQAKLVQELVRTGDPGALDLVDEFHPRIGRADEDQLHGFKRSDAQVVIARLYGFPSWTGLRDHVALVGRFAGADPADRQPEGAVDRFVALACVSYADGDAQARLDEAARLVASTPSLADADVAAMAVAGHHTILADRIEADPGLIDRPCGPNSWPPILYATYSRIDRPAARWSTLEVVRILLAAGADPNAGFLWRGLVPPFTALTGAFGRGELDQPRHPEAMAVARLLLEAGADPNDGQTLYNNGLAGSPNDDPAHLEILVEHGLGTDVDGPWSRRFGSRLTPPTELLYDELEVAAHRGLPNRLRFLVGLDLDLDRPVGRSGRTPADLARRKGHDDILDILGAAGVDLGNLDPGGEGSR